jgi:hypothetical protein
MFNFTTKTKQKLAELNIILTTIESSLDYSLRKNRSDRDYELHKGLDRAGIYQQTLKPNLMKLLISPSLYNKLKLIAKNENVDYDNLLVELNFSLERLKGVSTDTSFIKTEEINDLLRLNIKELKHLIDMI